MTGTSSTGVEAPRNPRLQPIMRTVVPHSPPEFASMAKERAEQLTFDVDKLEWKTSSTWIKLDLVPFATGQLRNVG